MLTVEIGGVQEVRKQFAEFSDRRFAAAAATALTRTAVTVRGEGHQFLQQAIDRPTPFTLRSLRYVGATAQRLVAAVGLGVVAITDDRGQVLRYQDVGPGETPAGRYLQPLISGGQRKAKRLEVALQAAGALPVGWYAVPGAGARLDAYGNVSRGQIVQILSQLRTQLVAGSTRNMSADARKALAAQRKAGGRFFVVPVGTPSVQPGVYQRELLGRNVTPVMVFVKRVVYRKRLDLPGMLQRRSAEILPREMQRALNESLQRMTGGAT